MASDAPLVSVILPVYNGGKFLRYSIESVLHQNFTDFEFILINDGSKDDSEKICLSYPDIRIRYVSQSNCGLARTLNTGIRMARGKFIARQDQDDLSLPNRLQKQIHYLLNHADVCLVGTQGKIINHAGQTIGEHRHPTHPCLLFFDVMFDNPFIHSSVVFRKVMNGNLVQYPEDVNMFEDYGLWSELAFQGKIVNLGEDLILYRHHSAGMSKLNPEIRKKMLFTQSIKNIHRLLSSKSDSGISQLCRLYFHQYDRMDDFDLDIVLKTLSLVGKEIQNRYPENARLIKKRTKQYEKVLKSRYNMFLRFKNSAKKFYIFLLKLEHKLRRYKSSI